MFLPRFKITYQKRLFLRATKGFTLIELLIVMAILGVLSIGLVAAINPTEKINAANDSRVLSDVGVQARAAESYATARNGFYPASAADLVTANELKFAPTPASGYGYNWITNPGSCTGGVDCTGIAIWSVMKSAKYSATPLMKYESATGKTCFLGPAITPVVGAQC